jgi:hypothetical protein
MMSIAAWAPSLLLVEQIWEVKCLFPLISEGVADNRPTQDSLPRDTFLQSPQPPKQAMMPPLFFFFFLEFGRCRTVARSLHEHKR